MSPLFIILTKLNRIYFLILPLVKNNRFVHIETSGIYFNFHCIVKSKNHTLSGFASVRFYRIAKRHCCAIVAQLARAADL